MVEAQVQSAPQRREGDGPIGVLDIPGALADDGNFAPAGAEMSGLHHALLQLCAVRILMHMEIGGIADKLPHQIIDRRHQHVAPLAQLGIGTLAAATGYGKIARNGETLDEMLAIGKAEGAIHDISPGDKRAVIEQIGNIFQWFWHALDFPQRSFT
jgi:hypothetical protein